MAAKGALLEESNCYSCPVKEGSSFSTALRYQYFTQGQEKECDSCRIDAYNKGAMKDLFEHFIRMHCDDVPHIDFYQAVWKALMALCELTHQSLNAMPKRCPMTPPRALKAANLDFVNTVEALYQTLDNPPTETAKIVPATTKTKLGGSPDTAPRRFRILSDALRKVSRKGTVKDKLGSSSSTDAVSEELRILGGVLRDLSTISAAKEEQVLSTLREFVELTRASKEDEHFRLTCTQSGELVFSRPPKIATITECMVGSIRNAGETTMNGIFSTIRHGKVLYDAKPRPATLIVLDLSLACLKGSSVDHAEIEITYKDEPSGSQKELQASRIIEPHDLCGLGNGSVVTEGRVFVPKTGPDEQASVRIYSTAGNKESIQDENICWKVRGGTVPHGGDDLRRAHRWVIDGGGDDKENSKMPDLIQLVAIVEHGLTFFYMEMEVKVRLRGLWRNSFRYLAELASRYPERFVIEPHADDNILTEELAKNLALERYKPYGLEQPREISE